MIVGKILLIFFEVNIAYIPSSGSSKILSNELIASFEEFSIFLIIYIFALPSNEDFLNVS